VYTVAVTDDTIVNRIAGSAEEFKNPKDFKLEAGSNNRFDFYF